MKARVVCLGCGVHNKNGESRWWGRKIDFPEGALGRRQNCACQGASPGQLRRCLLSGTLDDTDSVVRALLLGTPGPRGRYQGGLGQSTLSAVPGV